jgi:hypothetical protein|tara:strand:- start:9534 stop:9719 length:186 start_codon:yes stop_codon:yes gene_type:complete
MGAITAASNLTVNTIIGSHTGLGASVQTFLRTLSNGDIIHDITIVKKAAGNNYIAYITYET